MTTGVKIAIGVTAALALFGFTKKNNYVSVLREMKIAVDNIRKLRYRNGKIYTDVDVILINPTKLNFSPITAGAITLRRISLKMKGTLLGNGLGTVKNFDLPAGGTQKIEKIEIEILSLEILNLLFTGSFSTNPNDYTIEVELNALGKTWIIEQ